VTLQCQKKKKEYKLQQPETGQISFAKEKEQGYCSMIDEWFRELTSMTELLR